MNVGKLLTDTGGINRVRYPHIGRTKARSLYGSLVTKEFIICSPTNLPSSLELKLTRKKTKKKRDEEKN